MCPRFVGKIKTTHTRLPSLTETFPTTDMKHWCFCDYLIIGVKKVCERRLSVSQVRLARWAVRRHCQLVGLGFLNSKCDSIDCTMIRHLVR